MGAVALVGVAAFFVFKSRGSETLHPRRGEVVESIYGLGTVAADSIFRARVGVNLTVDKVFVKEGDTVRSGDPLIKLDQSFIRSPIAGTVTQVLFKPGEMAPAQSTLLTVTNFNSLFLEVSLEQQSVLRVRKGQEALVSFESLRNEKLSGKVASVYARDNQFIVRIEMPTWPAGVLPDMTADTVIVAGKTANALLIPVKAIVGGQVTRIRNGKKDRIPVKLDTMDGEWGEVVSGDVLETDELLIRK